MTSSYDSAASVPSRHESYICTRALFPGDIVASLGDPTRDDATVLHFDYYGPLPHTAGESPEEWVEFGHLTYRDSNGRLVTGRIAPMMGLMSLGNGYWTWLVNEEADPRE